MKRKFEELSLYVRNWSVVKGIYGLDWIYLEDLPEVLLKKEFYRDEK